MNKATFARTNRIAILCLLLATAMLALRIYDLQTLSEQTHTIHLPTLGSLPFEIKSISLNNGRHQIIVNTQLGFPLVIDKRDGIVGWHLLDSGLWEKHITQVLNRLVAKGDTVIEVGANYGYHTIHLSQLIGDSGKLFTYEANDEVCTILNKNIILNDTQHNTHMSCSAVTDHLNKVVFFNRLL